MAKFNGWYFQASYGENGAAFMIVSKEFWDQNGHLDDSHIAEQLGDLLPKGFYEMCESMFETDLPVKTATNLLLKAGFEEKVLFEDEEY
jgi:hypothetical protein